MAIFAAMWIAVKNIKADKAPANPDTITLFCLLLYLELPP